MPRYCISYVRDLEAERSRLNDLLIKHLATIERLNTELASVTSERDTAQRYYLTRLRDCEELRAALRRLVEAADMASASGDVMCIALVGEIRRKKKP